MRYRLWILLAVAALPGAAFWLLDFHVAASDTRAEKSISTAGIGTADELPHSMQRRDTIGLAVTGEGPLAEALQKALLLELRGAGLGEIELVQGTDPGSRGPLLAVRLEEPRLLWTPFYAASRFTVQAGYSSSGETPLPGEGPLTVDNLDGPALNMYGEYTVSDRSRGLISRPGYNRILADYLAGQIVEALKELYHVHAVTDS